MTITGINNYGGSKVYTIHVININSWSALKEALTADGGTITLYNDLSDVENDGALVVSHNMVLDLNGHTLNRNRTEEDYGYVIKVESGASLTIINGTITGGWNSESGGGVRFRIGKINAYINNCTITKNVSNINKQSKGGGIYFESTDNNGRLNVTGGLICVNTVSTEGGAVYVNRGIISLQDCELLGNVSGDIGGALSVYGNNHGKIIINDCGINGNNSKNQGGGVITVAGSLLLGAVIGVSRDGTGTYIRTCRPWNDR